MKRTPLLELVERILRRWQPPENLTVDLWADQYRVLSGGLSAEAGRWRTSRTEYMREPFRAFTDPSVEEFTVVSPSQVGKSELELNIILYIIDQDPGTVLYIHPSKVDAKEFSRLRLEPALRGTPQIWEKMKGVRQPGKKQSDEILMKSFPGGMLSIVGSNSASGLSSKPARYIIGDELDRWALSAGRDGDPWELAKKRQTTFFNRKRVAVSTPTIKGESQIEFLYYRGTQERYKTQCPHCGEYHEIKFDDIRFEATPKKVHNRLIWDVVVHGWRCPGCKKVTSEHDSKRQPCKWVAEQPDNLARNKARSFWLNGFVSPWSSWAEICKGFCEARQDPEKLQVWKNTTLGELWERRSVNMEESALMERSEIYPENADLPGDPGKGAAPLLLTCGVDCQHSYMQYEIVGWGRFGESWGIRSGFIQGAPDSDEVWAQLDSIVSRTYRYTNGKELRVSATFVDSGDGNYTNEIARRTAARMQLGVFACKGDGTHGKPLVSPAKWLPIAGNEREKYPLYVLGVNAGKEAIMQAVAVQEHGANYMHLPAGEDRGYDLKWYSGLLSEVREVKGASVKWVKLPGHERNEALDCRNYARAAYKAMNPDFDAIEAALSGEPKPHESSSPKPAPARRKSKLSRFL